MGFGTLFIGYFLILNVTGYAWSDLIAVLVMALGLYRLASINRYFKYSLYASLAMAVVGLLELVRELIRMLAPGVALPFDFLSPMRSAVLCALSVTMLFGIYDLAKEVDLPVLAARAKRMIIPGAVIYALTIILDTPVLFLGLPPIFAAAFFAVVLIATLFFVIYNLITIYSAYMRICMPSDVSQNEKKSRFNFVNEFNSKEAQKAAEYQKYKREKRKNKDSKK